MGIGALIQGLKELKFFVAGWSQYIPFGSGSMGFAKGGASATASTGGGALLSTPGVSPAYMGVGYIIGPNLAALNFTGGLLAWGLFVPLLLFFLGPTLEPQLTASLQAAGNYESVEATGELMANLMWSKVRLVAIGGMLMSAVFTLYRMRKSLASGLARAIGDVKKAAGGAEASDRTQKDIGFNFVLLGIAVCAAATFGIYYYFAQNLTAAVVATLVMVVAGFFFAAVSGNLVGLIGSSNNPISGLTISTLIIAALLMVALGVEGTSGVVAVLGVAAPDAAGSQGRAHPRRHAVAHADRRHGRHRARGGGDVPAARGPAPGRHQPGRHRPRRREVRGAAGEPDGDPRQGHRRGRHGLAADHRRCADGRRPDPRQGQESDARLRRHVPAARDLVRDLRRWADQGPARHAQGNGVLLASGLIAGEALIGLLFAGMAVGDVAYDKWLSGLSTMFPLPFGVSALVFVLVAFVLIRTPLNNAGRPEDPAPPAAMM